MKQKGKGVKNCQEKCTSKNVMRALLHALCLSLLSFAVMRDIEFSVFAFIVLCMHHVFGEIDKENESNALCLSLLSLAAFNSVPLGACILIVSFFFYNWQDRHNKKLDEKYQRKVDEINKHGFTDER